MASKASPQRVHSVVSATARSSRFFAHGLGFAAKAAPRYAAGIVVASIIMGISPTVSLLIQRAFVNHFAATLGGGGGGIWTAGVFALLIAFLLLGVLDDAAETINIACMTAVRDRIEGVAKERLFARLARATSLDLFENPPQLNSLNLAYAAIPRFQQLGERFMGLVLGVFLVVPALILSGTIVWWVPIILCATLLPTAIAQLRIEGRIWDSQRILAEDRRRQSLIEETLTRPPFAKDIRLFGLASPLGRRWHDVFDANFARVNGIRVQGMRTTVIWSLFGGLGSGLPLIYVVNGVAKGHISLGDLVLYIGVIVAARRGFTNVIYAITQISGITLGIEHYERFMDSTDRDQTSVPSTPIVPPLTRSLSIDGLTFRYPGSPHPSIRDLSVKIERGSTLAIVGENGAGKSTLAKLIGRLYVPSEGAIWWDEFDIATFDIDAYRRRLGFMNQDIAEFPFSLRENLCFARVENAPTDEELRDVLDAAGLLEVGNRTDQAFDVPITKELEGGTQLSGGQWQRLAMARVMLRAKVADLLVLDEPTAAFDPASEHEMIERLLEMSRDRTAIIVTHRLALCPQVDRIVVMHQGVIVEDGTHPELILRGGRYAGMFATQAARYVAP